MALESRLGGREGSDMWSAVILSLPGSVPVICLDSLLKPFGWMKSGRDGREGCSGERRQSSETKVGKCRVCSEG